MAEKPFSEIANLYRQVMELFPKSDTVEITSQGRTFKIDNTSIHENGKFGEWRIAKKIVLPIQVHQNTVNLLRSVVMHDGLIQRIDVRRLKKV